MIESAKSAAYAVLDFCTGGRGFVRRINGEAIRFPVRWARYFESDYEPETFAFVREHLPRGGTAIDVGAHIGLFSVMMARRVGAGGRVISLEPTTSTRAVLREVVRRNGCERIVQVRGEAVTSTSGVGLFFEQAPAGCNANSLVASDREHTGKQVPTVSLDDLAAQIGGRVDFVKIDAEGAELEVLRGGVRTLKESRPAVSLALHPEMLARAGGSLEEIWRVLDECAMSVWSGGRRATPGWFCAQTGLVDVRVTPRSV